ncbi:MAG: hypothetical protein ACRBDI_09550 [Alphaproteobacteria bacterium]
MPLTQEFKDQVTSITSDLKNADTLCHIFGKGITGVIDENISDEQVSIIRKHASPSVFHNIIGDEKTIAEQITHTFSDPIKKSNLALKLAYDNHSYLAALVTTEESLNSVIHNMPKILGSKMSPQMNTILKSYENILNTINNMIETASQNIDNAEEITKETKENMINGIEYIAPLPDGFPEI